MTVTLRFLAFVPRTCHIFVIWQICKAVITFSLDDMLIFTHGESHHAVIDTFPTFWHYLLLISRAWSLILETKIECSLWQSSELLNSNLTQNYLTFIAHKICSLGNCQKSSHNCQGLDHHFVRLWIIMLINYCLSNL